MKTYRREMAFTGGPGRAPARHGTHSGFVRHRQVGEEACQACKAAHSAYVTSRREARRQAAQAAEAA